MATKLQCRLKTTKSFDKTWRSKSDCNSVCWRGLCEKYKSYRAYANFKDKIVSDAIGDKDL